MKERAQGFLLFSIVFSSVLSSAEISVPAICINAETIFEPNVNQTANKFNDTSKKEGEDERLKAVAHDMEKREAKFLNGEFNKNKEPDLSAEDSNFFDQNEPDKNWRVGPEGTKPRYVTQNLKSWRKAFQTSPEVNVLKSLNEYLKEKRVPYTFHGMRGKKSEDYENDALEPLDIKSLSPNQGYLFNSGLFDEGDKPMFDYSDLDDKKKLDDETYDRDLFNKRSPYSFQGMRGKKESSYDFKRAMGFLGMRGKKATEIWDSDGNYKRVPQTGFFGMKGKKAQSSGFFGMRGKKASPNAFFGIKGKREPLDYDLQDFSLLNEMKSGSESSRNRFRRGITWLNNSKKAKNAFFGIRGKKSTQERPDARFSSSYE